MDGSYIWLTEDEAVCPTVYRVGSTFSCGSESTASGGGDISGVCDSTGWATASLSASQIVDSVTTLTWAAPPGVDSVNIYLSATDQLFASGGNTGSATTGAWATDGLLFLLEDTSGDVLAEVAAFTAP